MIQSFIHKAIQQVLWKSAMESAESPKWQGAMGLYFSVQLDQGLHLKLIVEGVEEADQITLLEQLGCDIIQGCVFSPPLQSIGRKRLKDRYEIRGSGDAPPH
jgi:hypothetical protein